MGGRGSIDEGGLFGREASGGGEGRVGGGGGSINEGGRGVWKRRARGLGKGAGGVQSLKG